MTATRTNQRKKSASAPRLKQLNSAKASARRMASRIKDIENDREFKAHVYQQFNDLQPFLSAEAQVAVVLQMEEQTESEIKHDQFVLKLITTLPGGADGDTEASETMQLESEGRNDDVYEAFAIAKRNMQEQLIALHGSQIESELREEAIAELAAGGYTIH